MLRLLQTAEPDAAVGQAGHRCREVKRDGTAGLVGCWIKSPAKAAPHSRRVWPHALIALDQGHGRDAGLLLTCQ
jgi:hypothetical protein